MNFDHTKCRTLGRPAWISLEERFFYSLVRVREQVFGTGLVDDQAIYTGKLGYRPLIPEDFYDDSSKQCTLVGQFWKQGGVLHQIPSNVHRLSSL